MQRRSTEQESEQARKAVALSEQQLGAAKLALDRARSRLQRTLAEDVDLLVKRVETKLRALHAAEERGVEPVEALGWLLGEDGVAAKLRKGSVSASDLEDLYRLAGSGEEGAYGAEASQYGEAGQ